MIKVLAVNAFNLYGNAAEEDRFGDVEALIRGSGADIVAVQEIVARPEEIGEPIQRVLAERNVRRLADAVGLCCEAGHQPVLALGGGIHHTALLWRAGLEIVPGSVRRFERIPDGMWHSMVGAVFDLGGPRLRVGSVQLSPFDQAWAWSDAAQIMRAMNSDDIPGLVGGDFNGIGGDAGYDPDPYSDVEWRPDHAYQLDEHGQLDRRVARRLEGPGRMRDCARLIRAPWRATAGHWPADVHPPRRIDRWYATYHLPAGAVVGHQVDDSSRARGCTDHLPVAVLIEPDAL